MEELNKEEPKVEMDNKSMGKNQIIEILESGNCWKCLKEVQDILLQRELNDLRDLDSVSQYHIIVDKVGKYEKSVIPEPISTPEYLMETIGEGIDFNDITEENVNKIISQNELFGKLLRSKLSGVPLKIKVGVDPTAGQIHMGHGITLRMMRRFQQMGHKIQFIIGDATAMVGDSTDRMSARQALTKNQVDQNMQNYISQASRIIDLNPNNPNIEIFHNSEWLDMSMMKWLPILSKISASRSMDRRDFQNRLLKGGSISLGELMYATFMAFDSLHLVSDIEIGGLDQYLNFLQTRDLMRKYSEEPETVVTVDLLPGTTGAKNEDGSLVKMSKSKGNYIALDENPATLYTKVMSIPDSLLPIWFRELTEISSQELEILRLNIDQGNLDPFEVKRMLARVIVASLNNQDMDIVIAAENASKELVGRDSQLRPYNAKDLVLEKPITFLEIFERIGETYPNLKLDSRSKIRKFIGNQGIKVLRTDPETQGESYEVVILNDLKETISEDTFLKIGKKNSFKISLNPGEK